MISKGRTRLMATPTAELRGFAEAEAIDLESAAERVAKFVVFHRAAEVFAKKPLPAGSVVAAAERVFEPDAALCSWLAEHGSPSKDAPAWSAEVYGVLFSPADRRARGQFFTSPPIADFMVRWAVRQPNEHLLDPGCGPGGLLAVAHRRLKELGAADPRELLHGVEICPLARTFASLCLLPARGRSDIAEVDFLTEYSPRRRFDAIVCNPPYSRHQHLDLTYKERVAADVDRIVGEHLSRRAGLYVHFLLKALQLVKEGGRLAFITPREFMDVHYGGVPKRFILERCRLKALVVFDTVQVAAFPGIFTTSAITLIERGDPDEDEPIRVIHVRVMPEPWELEESVDSQGHREFTWGWVDSVPRHELAAEQRWSRLLPGQSRSSYEKDDVPLGNLVRITRGIATGANHYFVLTSAEVKAARIERRYLRPVLGRSRLAANATITKADVRRWSAKGERVWLLDVRREPHSLAVKSYLRKGKKAGVHKGYLCSSRDRWYEMEKRDVPPIVVTYMSKGRPRFIRNDAGVLPLNVFHGIYPQGLSAGDVERLLAYLRSDGFLRRLLGAARFYADGLLKLEPGDLARVKVPDVRNRSALKASLLAASAPGDAAGARSS